MSDNAQAMRTDECSAIHSFCSLAINSSLQLVLGVPLQWHFGHVGPQATHCSVPKIIQTRIRNVVLVWTKGKHPLPSISVCLDWKILKFPRFQPQQYNCRLSPWNSTFRNSDVHYNHIFLISKGRTLWEETSKLQIVHTLFLKTWGFYSILSRIPD